MNLADMLGYADIHQLSRIAGNYQCECSAHSKNELIQSILTALNRKGVFEQTINNLNVEDIRFISSLSFDPRDTFSLEELIARVRQTFFDKTDTQRNPREMISEFKRRGWLFNGYSQQTKYLFQVPQDLKNKFCDSLARRFEAGLVRTGVPPVYRDEYQLILDDIHEFLRFVYHNEIPLTADGVMYKRWIQQALDSFSVREEPLTGGGWRFGYGRKHRDYPNRFSLIYDYCYFNQLIEEQENKLVLTCAAQAKVRENAREEWVQVYRMWLRLYKGAILNLQPIVRWIDRLARQWVTVDSLKPVLCKLIKPYYYDSPESILEQRILQMLMHLGILRIGEHEQQGKVVQVTSMGSKVIRGTFVQDQDTIQLPDDMDIQV